MCNVMYYFAPQENSVATKRESPFKVKSTFSKYFSQAWLWLQKWQEGLHADNICEVMPLMSAREHHVKT